ncbi:MAG: VPLPA-CTERM sorting domain-containing protein [Gammaproteobacteria bacterium]
MTRVLSAVLLGVGLLAGSAHAATINFDGPLVLIETNDPAARYSGTSLGSLFTGNIDDTTFAGSITGDGITTDFTCCIDAGPNPSFDDDVELLGGDADFLNSLAGKTVFTSGDIVDIVDIEGDVIIGNGNRIEVGLSYILASSADTYPFDPAKRLLTLYFIVEELPDGSEIYNVLGRDYVIPLPASVWLFGSAIGLLGFARRRAKKSLGA